jgi:branched-chain amino acid transport system permease protein
MDTFLVEAMINGILLGGVFALLAIGLNLIFGVIDVVWIAYTELVMVGMYTIYSLYVLLHLPLLLACVLAVAVVTILGILVHFLLIAPILNAPPINQLLATGGLLFFLQSLATLIFGTDFRSIGVRMPSVELAGMSIGTARVLAFAVALLGVGCLYLFLKRSFWGLAIRGIAQDRYVIGLMGIDQRVAYGITSAIGGALAGLAACLLVLQYDIQPFIGNSFGPIVFMICVFGGLGNLVGGFLSSFIVSEIIAITGYYISTDISYVLAFVAFIVIMFMKPRGIFSR